MVSLEEQMTYIQRIEANPKLSAFKNLLSGQPVICPDDNKKISETEQIYYEIASAIQSNDKEKFTEYYNKKNKSNPSRDNPQPFVHDDFLIFGLIVGIAKFNYDKKWIKSVISARTKNDITTTFENILGNNFNHSENNKSIILMYLHLISQSEISDRLINQTFENINRNSQLFQNKNDFVIISSLISYNKIIGLKTLSESNEILLLKSFEVKFTDRIKILAWFIQTVILILFLYGVLILISIKPEIKDFFDNIGSIFTLLGIIGISQIGNVSKWLKNQFIELFMRLLGYPKGLLKRNKTFLS
ncbi:MAG: hypothetical protein LBV47_04235 [Bacteroidales bacterium]|jgi:hypothetical protein|nr:hypothetical protein [Bacteroidales bacterium]